MRQTSVTHRGGLRRAFVLFVLLAMMAAACSSGSEEPQGGSASEADTDATSAADGADSADGDSTDAEGAEGEGQTGGTLKLAGNADVLYLDPAASYGAGDYQIQRAITRGLFAYVPSDTPGDPQTLEPDLALEIPTQDNGGISDDGLTYTIEMQEGVQWNAPDGPREIVADDIVRGVKRMCNPVVPSNARSYYTATIAGFAEFCDGFTEVEGTVEAIRAYIEDNEVEGVTAVDDHTIEFTLTQPASDFLSILALGKFAAPQPVEYLDYLPDSPELRQNTISSGPYMITEYVPDQSYVLERNEVWDPETDNIREAYVDRIEIAMGQTAESVQQQITAGTVDMQWNDTVTPTPEIPALLSQNDDRLVIAGDGSIKPYVVINTLSPNEDGAYADPLVRQALNFAVDKTALIQTMGGEALAQPAWQVLPPQVPSYEDINPLDVPVEGDPERAQELLDEAGYGDGLDVVLLYRETQPYRDMATIMQQDLEEAGFNVELKVSTQNAFYTEYLLNEDVTRGGEWDIALAAWGPDYLNGRAYIVPMLDGRDYAGGSPNFGGFNSEELNAAIDAALAADDAEAAQEHWAEADRIAAEQAAWVPVAFSNTPTMHSDRVGGFTYYIPVHNGDMVNAWIEE